MPDDSHAALASYAHSLVPRSLAEAAPGLATLLRYPRSYLRSDLVAGVTVGAVAVPSSLAMAELAGLPVVYGLYGTSCHSRSTGCSGRRGSTWSGPTPRSRR